MDEEIWKDIKGYEGYYQISNTGKVRSMARIIEAKNGVMRRIFPRILAPDKTQEGYHFVSLCRGNGHKNYRISRLVAIHFIPNPDNKPEVNHIDGNKDNNNIENLEWATPSENKLHAIYTGLRRPTYGMKPVKCLNDGKMYRSASEAARILRLDDSSVSKACRGILAHVKGYRFVYL